MNRPLHVLHLGAGNLFGGVERCLLTLAQARGFAPGMVPSFALAFGNGPVAGGLAAAMGGTLPAGYGPVRAGRPWTVWRARRRLGELLRGRQRPDVAVCHAPWTLAVTGPALRAAGVPVVFWMHDAATGRHWTERWAGWQHPPDAVIVNSRWTAGGLPALFGARRARGLSWTVLPYPVAPPPPLDPGARAATRAGLGAGPDEVVILQISRMEAWKGHREHLEALGRLRGLPGWTCWMVGGAQRPAEVAYRAELEALAGRLGVADRVRFLGQRADVETLLAAADVFCQPNAGPEPFGIVFVEALHAGLPVVSSAAGGALEIMDLTCGRLVPPGDGSALTAVLRELVTDPAARQQLAAGGPARARALCDPAVILERLETILRPLAP